MGRWLVWPLPALLTWASAWALFLGVGWIGWGGIAALLTASTWGVAWSGLGGTWWRRGWIACGFPLSLAMTGSAAFPSWVWLLPLALCLLIYPLNAWRDAPLFPTPENALEKLSVAAPLPAGALILDAGCGLGHALRALKSAYPHARHHGIEWSWPLKILCTWRCPWAQVRHGDIWRADWSPYDMVYLFQRPESMARAVAKAAAEMRPGSWLVSLEFEAGMLRPTAVLHTQNERCVWLYRAPFNS